jgi:hypothetical protein
VHALYRFLYSKNSGDYKISSRDYEEIRKLHSASISAALKGKRKSEEAKKNMSIGQKRYFQNNPGHWKGKTHSEKTRIKMSEKQSNENNPQFGKPRTEEEKKKISETMKGHKKSPATVEKFRNRTMTVEARRKITEGLKLYHARRKMEKMGSAVHEGGS